MEPWNLVRKQERPTASDGNASRGIRPQRPTLTEPRERYRGGKSHQSPRQRTVFPATTASTPTHWPHRCEPKIGRLVGQCREDLRLTSKWPSRDGVCHVPTYLRMHMLSLVRFHALFRSVVGRPGVRGVNFWRWRASSAQGLTCRHTSEARMLAD